MYNIIEILDWFGGILADCAQQRGYKDCSYNPIHYGNVWSVRFGNNIFKLSYKTASRLHITIVNTQHGLIDEIELTESDAFKKGEIPLLLEEEENKEQFELFAGKVQAIISMYI